MNSEKNNLLTCLIDCGTESCFISEKVVENEKLLRNDIAKTAIELANTSQTFCTEKTIILLK